MAKRIQRRREKGWAMPAGAVYVGRPTKYGNPIPVPLGASRWQRDLAVKLYRQALLGGSLRVTCEDVRRELRGHDLACWCPLDAPCHADVLLAVANGEVIS